MRKEKEIKRPIEELVKENQKNLAPKERRRVKEYLERKAKIPPFDEKCKQCGKAIPKPFEFCSSKCMGRFNGRKKENRKEGSKGS